MVELQWMLQLLDCKWNVIALAFCSYSCYEQPGLQYLVHFFTVKAKQLTKECTRGPCTASDNRTGTEKSTINLNLCLEVVQPTSLLEGWNILIIIILCSRQYITTMYTACDCKKKCKYIIIPYSRHACTITMQLLPLSHSADTLDRSRETQGLDTERLPLLSVLPLLAAWHCCQGSCEWAGLCSTVSDVEDVQLSVCRSSTPEVVKENNC